LPREISAETAAPTGADLFEIHVGGAEHDLADLAAVADKVNQYFAMM
jgi:hypothetical protein